ncbi:MAG TPA: GxxExxY protein [Candidatus Saccharimonadales bacterium]|nr:GxxExxY protein [Candidatus Saccharimonadales bacterium]
MSAKSSETIRETTQQATLIYPGESYIIQGACFAIYKKFRNTQKETVYQKALLEEIKSRGLKVEREKQLPVYHLGVKVGVYIPDLLINDSIIIELKAKPFLHKTDISQFWFYLKNSEYRLGYLVNFGESSGVKMIRRVYDIARKNTKPYA